MSHADRAPITLTRARAVRVAIAQTRADGAHRVVRRAWGNRYVVVRKG